MLRSCRFVLCFREERAADDGGRTMDLTVAAEPRFPEWCRGIADFDGLQMVQDQLQPGFLHDHDPLSFCGQGGLVALRARSAVARGAAAVASVLLQLVFDDACRIRDAGCPSWPLDSCALGASRPCRCVLSDFISLRLAVCTALLGLPASPAWRSGRSSASFGGGVLGDVSGMVAPMVSSWRCRAMLLTIEFYAEASVLLDLFR